MQLISGFIDTYLHLNPAEEIQFQEEISTFSQPVQEGVMQITTSWMRQGIEQGIEQGEMMLLRRMLAKRFGDLPEAIKMRLSQASIADLELWGDRILEAKTLSDIFD